MPIATTKTTRTKMLTTTTTTTTTRSMATFSSLLVRHTSYQSLIHPEETYMMKRKKKYRQYKVRKKKYGSIKSGALAVNPPLENCPRDQC